MNRFLLYGLWSLLLPGYGQQNATFRTQVNRVDVTAVVHSAGGLLVSNLTAQDLEILEDGVPQTIRFFAREAELPLSLGLLVDASGSQERFVHQHLRDIATFLIAVLHSTDQVFAVCFGNHLRLVSDLASSASSVTDGLQRFAKGVRIAFPEIGPLEERDLGTALYDAIYFSIQERIAGKGEHRRALIVFSDGEENSSEHDLLDAIEAAQSSNTLVYFIRYTPIEHGRLNAHNRYGMRVSRHLADLTGASDFDARSTDLEIVFKQIGDEIRGSHYFGYSSTNAPSSGQFISCSDGSMQDARFNRSSEKRLLHALTPSRLNCSSKARKQFVIY